MICRSSLFSGLVLCALSVACSSNEDRRGPPSPTAPREVAPRVPAPRVPETLPEPREVGFPTSDGVSIAGTLQPGARPDAPLVILVHQLGGSRAEWEPLLERLHARPAIATLAIDLRGHGASTADASGQTIAWRDLDNAQWALTAEDVRAAIEFLRRDDAGVSPSRLAVAGSSMGSSAAIAAAARAEGVHAIAALSPGRAYRGFDAITPATQLGRRPFLAIVAREETDSVETAEAMARITGGEAVVVEGSAHGLALLRDSEDTLERVESFLRNALQAERDEG